jgi:small-conductance mechanosensitive channel
VSSESKPTNFEEKALSAQSKGCSRFLSVMFLIALGLFMSFVGLSLTLVALAAFIGSLSTYGAINPDSLLFGIAMFMLGLFVFLWLGFAPLYKVYKIITAE